MSNISLGILLSSEAVFESLILEADRGLSHYFFAFEDGGQTRLTDAETSEFVIYCAQCTEKVQVNVLTEGPRSNCEHVFKALGEDEVTREEWIARTRGGRDLCNNLYANFANPGSNKRDRMLTLACTLCGFSMSFRRSSQELSKHLAGVLLNSSREDTIYSLYALKRYVEGFIEDSGRPVNSENKNFLRVFKDAQTFLLKIYFGIIIVLVDKFLRVEYVDPDISLDALKQVNVLILKNKNYMGLDNVSQLSSLPRTHRGSNIMAKYLSLKKSELQSNAEINIANRHLKLGKEISWAYLSIGAGLFFSENDLKSHYLMNSQSNPALIPLFLSALEEISMHLRSPDMQELIVIEKSKGFYTLKELGEAYATFELDHLMSDSVHAEKFISAIVSEETGYLKREIIQRAKYIAAARRSDALLDIANYGIVLEDKSTTDGLQNSDLFSNLPPGLVNIGNTCYLNSLVQYLYTIKDLRKFILDGQVMSILGSENDTKTNFGTALKLDENPDSHNDVPAYKMYPVSVDRLKQASNVFRSLHKLFHELTFSDKRIITPEKDIAETFLNQSSESGYQQDINEQLNNVIELLSIALKYATTKLECSRSTAAPIILPNFSKYMVDRLFYGLLRRTTSIVNEQGVSNTSVVDEPFSDIHVDVSISLEDSLHDFFKSSKIESDGNAISTKLELVLAPPVLTIHIKRVGFDRELLKVYKNNNWVKFQRDLDISPYFVQPDHNTQQKRTRYTLHSVFSHEGIPLYGHYWITIYDSDSGSWIEYNDTSVRTVSESAVFDLSSKSSATAYLLVYIHANEKDTLINTTKNEELAGVGH